MIGTIAEPLYIKIYNYLVEEIKSQKIKSNQRIPSEKELAVMFSVSRITSKRALEMLVIDGLIVRLPGKGSFVSPTKSAVVATNNLSNTQVAKRLCIGVILPDYSESYGIGLISGIEERCSKENIFNITRRSHGNRQLEEEAIEDFIQFGVDGIIIMPVHGEYYNPKILKLILDGFPLVIMDRQLLGIQSAFVGSDNVKAAKNAVQFLYDLGHKDICFISPPPENNTAIDNRISGVASFYNQNGLNVEKSNWLIDITCTMPGHNDKITIDADIERIKHHLIKHTEISAIFASEYNIALIVEKAINQMGKKIPDDYSLISFDNPIDFLRNFKFTHILQREQDIGSISVDLIIEQKKGNPETKQKKILVDTDLIIGESTVKKI
jgi:GntR family transcriptional regulator of arabinose operon